MSLVKSLSFLKDLAANNNKEWMDANRALYLDAKEEFVEFVEAVIDGVARFDPAIQGQPAKKCIFRINRDIRFSKDKSPYKSNFGAALAEGGRNSGNPVYYFHVQPEGESMLAGGLYMPAAEPLKKIRQEIDYNPEELKQIVEGKAFKNAFGGMSGDRLKTAPKGYPKDHPNIELLRHKSFVAFRNLTDQEVLSDSLLSTVLSHFELIHPMNQYLSVAIS